MFYLIEHGGPFESVLDNVLLDHGGLTLRGLIMGLFDHSRLLCVLPFAVGTPS